MSWAKNRQMLPYKVKQNELYPRDVRTIFTHDNHAILINLNDQEAMLTKQVATSKNETLNIKHMIRVMHNFNVYTEQSSLQSCDGYA
jgi:hypothetical protein